MSTIPKYRKRKRKDDSNEIDPLFLNTKGSFLTKTEFTQQNGEEKEKKEKQKNESVLSKESIEQAFKELAKQTQLQKPSENELKALWREAARIWKDRVWKDWYEDKSGCHVCQGVAKYCVEKEEIKKLPLSSKERQKKVEYHQNCKICMTNDAFVCDMDNVYAIAYKHADQKSYHVCLPLICASRKDSTLHHQQLYVIDYLYICKKTGLYHACTPEHCHAPQIKDRSGRNLVCSISGQNVSHELMTEEQGNNNNDNATKWTSQNLRRGIENVLKSKPTKYQVTANTVSQMDVETVLSNCINQEFGTMQFKKKKCQDSANKSRGGGTISWNHHAHASASKEDYFKTAIQKCSLIFSEKRLSSHDRKKAKMDAELQKDLEKCCSAAYQNRRLPSTQQLHIMVDIYRKKNYLAPDMKVLAQADNRRLLISHYARQCVIFWHIVHTYTNVRELVFFTFPDFVDSTLSILEEGLGVSIVDYDYPLTLIKKDKLLNILSLEQQNNDNWSSSEENEEDALLDLIQGRKRHKSDNNTTTISRRSCKKERRGNRTYIKNYIQQAILETIRKRVIHPDVFYLENYQYEDLPETTFQKNAQERGANAGGESR